MIYSRKYTKDESSHAAVQEADSKGAQHLKDIGLNHATVTSTRPHWRIRSISATGHAVISITSNLNISQLLRARTAGASMAATPTALSNGNAAGATRLPKGWLGI